VSGSPSGARPRLRASALRLPPPTPGPLGFSVGRLRRTYRIHRPPGDGKDGAVPLVVVLHGGFGSGEQAERSYRWNDAADANGFVVCYPDGLMRAWNAGTCCGEPMRRGVDDVAFLADLLDRVEAEERIDPGRIFATGMSNGAMMVYRLAAELPGRLAAIGPVAGTMTVPIGPATMPVSVCHIHGLADDNVPFAGGSGSRAVAHGWRRPVADVIAEWRSLAGCGPARVWQSGPVRVETAEGKVEVALVTVAGAGHQWPGSVVPPARVQRALLLDPPSSAISATAMLWDFFVSRPRTDRHQVRPEPA
jgi:polyhydroxybutyrate depolymerase